MLPASVPTLLDAVRRRLWRAQFVAGARLALWGSAGLLLCAVAVHLAVRPVPAGAVMIALAVLWAALLARAAGQRPADAGCALWADRHLGGASAFSTWLELRGAAPTRGDALAVRRLDDWASARVPPGLRLLAGLREPARLAKPLSSMLVSAALAMLVFTLPDPAPSPAPQAVEPSTDRAADAASAVGGALFSPPAVSEIASALRRNESEDAAERPPTGRAPANASGQAGTDDPGTAAAGGTTTPAGEQRTAAGSPAGTAGDAAAPAGSAMAAGAGAGRSAGDSLDERADGGVSRALPGPMAVQRVEPRPGQTPAEWRADLTQAALYDDVVSAPAGMAAWAETAAPPATPPAATPSTRLTPTEASYVQAWMKANGPRR